jgi:hypothetical protein
MTPEFAPPDPLPQLSAERQEEFVLLLNAAHGLLLRYLMSLVANRHDAEDVLSVPYKHPKELNFGCASVA